MSNRPNDHLLVQFGYTGWAGKPDSINTGGLSKSINVYFMFDFPFKTNPKLSMAFGPGIASDHILFSETHVGLKDNTSTLYFTNQSDTNHFKKTKLATVYLDPVSTPEPASIALFASGLAMAALRRRRGRSQKSSTPCPDLDKVQRTPR